MPPEVYLYARGCLSWGAGNARKRNSRVWGMLIPPRKSLEPKGRGLAVPLSEHEQRLLEQMEKALYAEDPKFATSLRSTGVASRGRAALGVLAVLAGLGIVLAGMALPMALLGVVGFVVMLAGAVMTYFAFTRGGKASTETAAPDTPTTPGSTPAPPRSSGFMDRMEERWRKRSEGDG